MFQHQIYLSSAPGGRIAMTVKNNDIWTHDVTCAGPRLVVHGSYRSLVIENNRFRSSGTGIAAGCYQLQLDPGGYPCGTVGFENVVIRRNRILGPNNGWYAIDVNATTNAIIEDNLTVGGTGIRVACATPSDGSCYPINTQTKVRNNTVHIQTGQDQAQGIQFCNEGTGHVIAANAVFAEANQTTCVSPPGSVTYNGANYCRQPGGAAIGTVFVDATNGDYTPAASGPLIGGGNATYGSPYAMRSVSWSVTDTAATRGSPPDVGALQH
jgi:hypothetical protein